MIIKRLSILLLLICTHIQVKSELVVDSEMKWCENSNLKWSCPV